ncbi:MAG TPA: carboxypeptidase-like regulatory domain-containing protein, partial [Candidatus Kapabacteria bacterium]|nr:carboxypeptidase-like regulatory domain-containing protein [Candidatus Kapabacteria bacterium]
MARHLRVFLALCFIVTFAGCGEESSSTSPLPSGTMYGYAVLSAWGKQFTDHSGIKVSLKGTAYSTTTDETGKWEINDLPTRTYAVIYEKPGFGPMEEHGVVFVGGGHVSVRTASLYEVPSCGVELEAVREDEPGVIMTYAHSSCPLSIHTDMAVFFFSHSPEVSKDNYVVARNGSVRDLGTIEAELNSAEPYYFRGLDKTKPIYVVAYH